MRPRQGGRIVPASIASKLAWPAGAFTLRSVDRRAKRHGWPGYPVRITDHTFI